MKQLFVFSCSVFFLSLNVHKIHVYNEYKMNAHVTSIQGQEIKWC